MKKAGIITTATVAALILAGGGVALGMNLAGNDDPTETGPETTFTVEATMDTPAASATPETTPDEPATAEPSESAIATATAYSDDEEYFLYGARQKLAGTGVEPNDAELLAIGQQICDELEAGGSVRTIRLFDDAVGDIMQNDINATARTSICG